MVPFKNKYLKKSKFSTIKENLNLQLSPSRPKTVNQPKGKPGRPPKPKNQPIEIPLKFEELLKKPTKIQTLDEFSALPKKILNYIVEFHSPQRYKSWISSKDSPNRYKDSIHVEHRYDESDKQRFFEFMSIVVQRTRDSLNLNEVIGNFIKNVMQNFVLIICCEKKYEKNSNETFRIKQSINRTFDDNLIWRCCKQEFFDEKLFNGMIDVFFDWKTAYDEKFPNSI